MLIDYVRNADYIVEMDDDSEGYLAASGFKIAQHSYGTDYPGSNVEEEIRLYLPPPETRETNTATPLLRYFRQDYRADLEARRAGRTLSWPHMKVQFFDMTRVELDELDRLVQHIDVVCRSLDVQSDGVSIWWFYGPDRGEIRKAESIPWKDMIISLQSEPTITLEFTSGNSQLEPLWQAAWTTSLESLSPAENVTTAASTIRFRPKTMPGCLRTTGPASFEQSRPG